MDDRAEGGDGIVPPSAIVLSDRIGGASPDARAAEAAGCAVRVMPLAGDDLALLAAGCDLLLVDIDPADAAAEAMIAALYAAAAAGSHDTIVTVPRGLIDLAAAGLGDCRTTLLCEPTMMDRMVAIGATLAARDVPETRVAEGSERADLKALSEAAQRIARALAAMSGEPSPPAMPAVRASRGEDEAVAVTAAMIRTLLKARRLREQYFDPSLFFDPAWDMLLDLAASRLEGQKVSVSSLCIAAAVPPTTALRWIKSLTEAGLFTRVADAQDGRRVFIELSDAAADAVTRYVQAIARAGVRLA